jgi:uncharacterized Zn-binding protein involved in type VI secretion
MRKVKSKVPQSGMGIEGFYRVNIVDPDGTVQGDSGWKHNLIPSAGLTNYISYLFAGSAGSSRVGFMHLGSLVSSLATNDVSLAGEYHKSLMASVGSTQFTSRAAAAAGDSVRFLATFVSGSIISATNQTIGCIGLYATTAGSLMCGGSFTASTLGSNQAINCSYTVVFTASAS